MAQALEWENLIFSVCRRGNPIRGLSYLERADQTHVRSCVRSFCSGVEGEQERVG